MSKKIAVSLLVYNEGASIVRTVKAGYQNLEQLGIDFELWVIDNHSEDNTQTDVQNLINHYPRLKYLRHPYNIGYSLSTLSSFKKPSADIFVTVDGDGQYNLTDISILLKEIEKGNDLVYAIRVKRQDPFIRKLMSFVFNLISNPLLQTGLTDLNCGFRAMTKEAAQAIQIYNQIIFVGPEIYVRAKTSNLKITEVPVRHFPRPAGRGSFAGPIQIIKFSYLMMCYIWQMRKELYKKAAPQRNYDEKYDIFGADYVTAYLSSTSK
jgi:dolichol-phosphate mannosyltransferase